MVAAAFAFIVDFAKVPLFRRLKIVLEKKCVGYPSAGLRMASQIGR